MPQAIVDPGELRRFAQSLKRFNSELHENASALSNQLATLSQSWRDQENKRFSDEFQQNMKAVSRFIETNSEHIPYLLRKAQLIEEYLNER
jgi:uncharacterized protein YukE